MIHRTRTTTTTKNILKGLCCLVTAVHMYIIIYVYKYYYHCYNIIKENCQLKNNILCSRKILKIYDFIAYVLYIVSFISKKDMLYTMENWKMILSNVFQVSQ